MELVNKYKTDIILYALGIMIVFKFIPLAIIMLVTMLCLVAIICILFMPLPEEAFKIIFSKIRIKATEAEVDRILITPPTNITTSVYEFKTNIYRNLHSFYDDDCPEGEFNLFLNHDFSFFKAVWYSFKFKEQSPKFTLGVLATESSLQLYIDCPKILTEEIQNILKAEYSSAKFKVVEKSLGEFATSSLIIRGDWRERIVTVRDNTANPFDSILARLSNLKSSQKVELEYNIMPISRYYNCFVNYKLATESKKKDKAGYEQSKGAGYADIGKASLFQVQINLKTDGLSEDETSYIVGGFKQVEYPLGNRVDRGLIGNSLYNQSVVSEPELYSLWNVTNYGSKQQKARTNPHEFPRELAGVDKFLVEVGNSNYPNFENKKVGIASWSDLTKNVSITGVPGCGKSEILKSISRQLAEDDSISMFISDFKGDFAHEVVDVIPQHRLKDVIYICPSSHTLPMSVFNNRVNPDEDLATAIQMLVSLAQTDSDDSWGPQVEQTMKGLIPLSIKAKKPSLRYIRKLMIAFYKDKGNLKELLNTGDDNISSIISQVQAIPNYRISELISTPNNKIGKLIATERLKLNTDNYNAKLDFTDCIRKQKIVIINYTNLTSFEKIAFGVFYTTKIFQSISQQKEIVDKTKRHKVAVIIDEAQDIIQKMKHDFESAFSQFRGLNASLIIANQFSAQLPETVKIALSNAGTRIVMRVKNPTEITEQVLNLGLDEETELPGYFMNLPMGSGYIQTMRSDLPIPTTTFQYNLVGNDIKNSIDDIIQQNKKDYFVEDCDVRYNLDDLINLNLGTETKKVKANRIYEL
jgi:hypothetical protein